MKIKSALILILILAPLANHSQNIVFKANLPALAFNSYSPSIELPLSDRLSLSIGAGYVTPKTKKHNSVTGSSDDYKMDAFYRGPNFTTELRVYPFSNKSAPFGFYVGGFFRYMNYQMKLNFNYVDALGKQTVEGTGAAEGYGGGGMCGYQVKIGKVFVVDAFAGIGVVKTNAAGFFRNYGKDMDQYETLAAELGTAGKGFSNYRAGADHYFSFFYYKGGLPMIRAGLCIGVAFPGLKSVPLNFD